MTALKALTIWPAWQHFEEDRKGSIETGKLADFVVLSADPTAVEPESLDDIRVLATIKEDRKIYEAPAATAATNSGMPGFAGNPAVSHRFLEALYAAWDRK
jgi:urease alpha subunit